MGELYKISGPVIIGSGMKGSQINEVVKVGDEELLGEIIAVKEDRATIQVYEDTSGLKPGDRIQGTGAALQVELAPGLISGVFDGIQRPLNIIMEKTGSYIKRGVNIPALDYAKKWDFKASAKKGDAVQPGDVLGTVREGTIDHKILVPLGVNGKIESIESGKFTVKETVALIAGKNVQMLQKWSVRAPRPVKEKHRFSIPLITGKRIVDTFFPVAKGGTAAIPGPFGSGKCVSSDTPVLLQNGELKPIRQLFDEAARNPKNTVERSVFEETIHLAEPLHVYSHVNGKIQPTMTSLLYKGKSDSLLRVTTRAGRTLTVTPIHKLFRVSGDLALSETPAGELKAGDFLAAPRVLPALEKTEFDVYALPALRVVDDSIREQISRALRNRIHEVGKKQTSKELGLSEGAVKRLVFKETLPTLGQIQRVCAFYQLPLPRPERLRGERRGAHATLPLMSVELAEFLGLFAAEGYLRGSATVVFTNTDETLLQRFTELGEKLFHVPAKIERQKGKAPNVLATSIVLTAFLRAIGLGGKAAGKTLPAIVLSADSACLSSFLKAHYLSDGSFSGGTVELATASHALATGLAYAYARLGIPVCGREKTAKGYSQTYYRVFIRGKPNLDKLSQAFGIAEAKTFAIHDYVERTPTTYTATDIVPASPDLIRHAYETTGKPYAQLKRNGVEIHNYLTGERLSATAFRNLTTTLAASRAGQIQQLVAFRQALEWLVCDEITTIEELPGPHDVYDLSLPRIENWVGGNAPSLLHNTVNQQDLAKYADADVIVYVGCGERGNEMTEVLTEFPQLVDPRTKKPLMERTVLIANTSNMPVAAREASIYTGITIAEYYRDMGYSVALMADSTSRWAEAMREISGRMEEMPGEEGYPAYLARKLAEFYERSGLVTPLGSQDKQGSITVVGAVSPPGGDISEPVSQGTLRITKVFWALDANLSRRRHFPAINWLKSYSLYHDELEDWYEKNVAADFSMLRGRAMELLQKEAELQNIVQLIGPDALPDRERLLLEAAKMIREDFLQQNSYDEVDAYSTLYKQYQMLKVMLHFYDKASAALAADYPLEKIVSATAKEEIARLKRVPENEIDEKVKEIARGVDHAFTAK